VVDVGLPDIVNGRVITNVSLEGGTKYYAATAYDTSGVESDYSDEVVYSWMPIPNLIDLEETD
jgi:hypothetical protein